MSASEAGARDWARVVGRRGVRPNRAGCAGGGTELSRRGGGVSSRGLLLVVLGAGAGGGGFSWVAKRRAWLWRRWWA